MPHYHIRWSNSKLDWEAFPTSEEAQASAEQLLMRGESYVIEQVDGDCPRCSSLHNLAGRTVARTQKNVSNDMPQGGPCRRWQVIEQELSGETNSERILELSRELNRALDEQESGGRSRGHIAGNNPCPNKNQPSSDYERIVDAAVALMRSDYASMQMLFPERGSGGELRLLAFRGFNPQAAQFWKWVRADSKSTCGIALRDKRRVVAPNIATCDFMAGSEDQRTYLQTGIRACQTTPLIGRGGIVVGMISTHWRTPHQPSEKDFRLFDVLARQAADLIESCSGEEEQPPSDRRIAN
jgi:hypothetical protein